jgi:hypothetical protein
MATQSFDAAMQDAMKLLDVAEKLLKELRAAGVYGQDREFTNYVDVNRGALTLFERARGAQMRRNWDKL